MTLDERADAIIAALDEHPAARSAFTMAVDAYRRGRPDVAFRHARTAALALSASGVTDDSLPALTAAVAAAMGAVAFGRSRQGRAS